MSGYVRMLGAHKKRRGNFAGVSDDMNLFFPVVTGDSIRRSGDWAEECFVFM